MNTQETGSGFKNSLSNSISVLMYNRSKLQQFFCIFFLFFYPPHFFYMVYLSTAIFPKKSGQKVSRKKNENKEQNEARCGLERKRRVHEMRGGDKLTDETCFRWWSAWAMCAWYVGVNAKSMGGVVCVCVCAWMAEGTLAASKHLYHLISWGVRDGFYTENRQQHHLNRKEWKLQNL